MGWDGMGRGIFGTFASFSLYFSFSYRPSGGMFYGWLRESRRRRGGGWEEKGIGCVVCDVEQEARRG